MFPILTVTLCSTYPPLFDPVVKLAAREVRAHESLLARAIEVLVSPSLLTVRMGGVSVTASDHCPSPRLLRPLTLTRLWTN